MASDHSYTITLSNNQTEKRAVDYLLSVDNTFLLPTKEGRKRIMEILGIPKTFSRAFDLIQVPGYIRNQEEITIDETKNIVLIELKTTEKYLPHAPKGFFFGATQNEFDLAERMGNKYAFCFVCLNEKSKGFHLRTLRELNELVVTKRVQYQINL